MDIDEETPTPILPLAKSDCPAVACAPAFAAENASRVFRPSGAAPHPLAGGGKEIAEFEEGDPRRGPHTLEERAEAAALIEAAGRSHYRRPEIDWYAVRLQCGRGLKPLEAARMFNIGQSSVEGCRRRDGDWPAVMSERDRRRLSRLVWLAGIARGLGDNEASRAALKEMSEWRLPERKTPPTFELQDRYGAAEATINTTADPARDEHLAVRSKLDELIARMTRDGALSRNVADDT